MLLFMLIFVQSGQPAPQFEENWTQANQFYQEGKYQEALVLYQSLLDAGIQNGKLHFNAGNAYLKCGQVGKAVVHYCKARKLMPGDPDVTENLAIADENRVDKTIVGEDETFMVGFDKLAGSVRYPILFNLALAFIILAGLASLMLVVRPHSGKWLGYLLVISGVLGLILIATTYAQHRQLTRKDFAVLVASETDVLSGPSKRETVSFTIHEGMRCRILGETENWYRIGLANGYNGWVPRSAVEII